MFGLCQPCGTLEGRFSCLGSNYMSHLVEKPTMWFPNRSDINQTVQSQKRARSLKFWSSVEEELYYPSSENKGADQLRGYREAELRLCFRLCRLLVFPWGGSYGCVTVSAVIRNQDCMSSVHNSPL